jgi:hypothetical protein
MKNDNSFLKKESLKILIAGFAVLVLLIVVILKESQPEWQYYQHVFKEVLQGHADQELDSSDIPSGVKQIHLPDAGRVDRCQTCHLGIDMRGLEQAPLPYQTHPGTGILWYHPAEQFGCTLCHEGQGYALTKAEAHGEIPREQWPRPILPEDYLQASCGKCHNPELMEQDAPELFAGRQLYKDKGCKECHRIGPVGGSIGPEHSNLARFSIKYLEEAVMNPPQESVMPDIGFTREGVKPLVVYMLSLDSKFDDEVPLKYKKLMSKNQVTSSFLVAGYPLTQNQKRGRK